MRRHRTRPLTHTGSLEKIAHDPGDPQITSHCPFCGSGQIVGRSDGTIECDFCGMNYIVRVQPAFPGMPQGPGMMGAPTDVGPEMGPGGEGLMGPDELGPDGMPLDEEGGMPGEEDEEGGFPPDDGEEDDEEAPPFGGGDGTDDSDETDESGGKSDSKKKDKSKKESARGPRCARCGGFATSRVVVSQADGMNALSDEELCPSCAAKAKKAHGDAATVVPIAKHSTYLTIGGAELHEDAYVKHLAVLHGGDDPRVIAQIRAENEQARSAR